MRPLLAGIGQAFTQVARVAAGSGAADEPVPVAFEAVGDAEREADHQDRRDGARDRGEPRAAAHQRPARDAAQTGIQADGEDRRRPAHTAAQMPAASATRWPCETAAGVVGSIVSRRFA